MKKRYIVIACLALLLIVSLLDSLHNVALAWSPEGQATPSGVTAVAVSPVAFCWLPIKDTIKYKFVLARDAALTDVVAEAEVAGSTAYKYEGMLGYNTNYFWRVMGIEPAPSDWSATFTFRTEAPPPAAGDSSLPVTPTWVWIVIAIASTLAISILVAIFLSSSQEQYA